MCSRTRTVRGAKTPTNERWQFQLCHTGVCLHQHMACILFTRVCMVGNFSLSPCWKIESAAFTVRWLYRVGRVGFKYVDVCVGRRRTHDYIQSPTDVLCPLLSAFEVLVLVLFYLLVIPQYHQFLCWWKILPKSSAIIPVKADWSTPGFYEPDFTGRMRYVAASLWVHGFG